MKPLLFKIRSSRAPVRRSARPPPTLFGRGMDMALTVLVFLLIGWAVDRWLGTKPAVH